jgi:hypothetical protein
VSNLRAQQVQMHSAPQQKGQLLLLLLQLMTVMVIIAQWNRSAQPAAKWALYGLMLALSIITMLQQQQVGVLAATQLAEPATAAAA